MSLHRLRLARVPIVLFLLCAAGAVSRAEAPATPPEDAREDPSLRQPLPKLAPPPDTVDAPATFSTEAPPPPPIDPDYRPPVASPPGTPSVDR